MASLIKQGARKTLVENGVSYVGSTVVWVPSDPGFVRADHSLFTLTVSGTDAKYEVHLTEAEMIDVATAWLRLLKPHIEAAKAA